MLFSPRAGSGRGRSRLDEVFECLRRRSSNAVITSDVDRAREAIRLSPRGVLLAAGGDGTLRLAASLLPPPSGMGGEKTPTHSASLVRPSGLLHHANWRLMPVPTGTENLLSLAMGYRLDADDIEASLDRDETLWLDTLAIETLRRTHSSLVMATAGLDAEVVRRVHLKRQGHIRRWTYLRPLIQSAFRYGYRNIEVVVDDQPPISCRWAMAFNLPAYAAGLPIATGADATDGKIDVVCFQRPGWRAGLRYFASVMLGRHRKLSDVTIARGESVRFESKHPVPFQCDGDYSGRLPIRIECLPANLPLVRPATPPHRTLAG